MSVQTRQDVSVDKTKRSDHRVSDHVSDRVYAPVSTAPSRFVAAKPIARFVPSLTKKAFEKFGFASAAIVADWTEIVGAQIAEKCTPEKLKWPRTKPIDDVGDQPSAQRNGATLILKTDAAYALDIQYASTQIIERINAYFGYSAVTTLKIVQGPVQPDVGRAPDQPRPARPAMRADALAQACRTAIADIDDDDLQRALSRLSKSVFACD